MASFSITKPSPASGTISDPGKIKLSFDVYGNDPCNVKLSYTLDPGNNVFFLVGGSPTKEIIQQFVLKNPPKTLNDEVQLVKRGKNRNYSLCFINIDGIDLNNSDSDHQIFTVHFI